MRTSIQRFVILSLALAAISLAPHGAEAQKPIAIADVQRSEPVDFQRDVLPILRKNCIACHNSSDPQSDLVLETPKTILKGGYSGAGVVPKQSAESMLLKVASHREEPHMPPADNEVGAKPLTPEELGIIKLWIDEGATGEVTGSGLSPQEWQPLPAGVNPIYAVAVTPDGQFAACGRANQIFIYHVPTGQVITRLTDPELQARSKDPRPGIAHLDIVQALAFNREGDLLASGGFRNVKLWRRPRDVRRLDLAVGGAASVVASSPDGKTLAVAGADNSIKLWNLETGEAALALEGHTDEVTTLRFSQDGTRLFSGALDGTVRIWDRETGELAGRIDSATPVSTITLLADDALLATGGGDNLIRVWDVPQGLSQPVVEVPENSQVVSVSPDRSLVAVANAAGGVRVFNAEGGEPVHAWQAHDAAVKDVAFATEMYHLVTASEDGTAVVWNTAIGEPIATLRGSLAPVERVDVLPSAKHLVTGAADGKVTVWNVEAPEPRTLEGDNGGPARAVAVSPDGKLVASAGTSQERPAILVRNLESGEVVRTLLGHGGPVTTLEFSADNQKVLSGSADGTARVWDLTDGKFPERQRFDGHEGGVTSVAFATDGTQVATGSGAGAMKLWNMADASEVQTFPGHQGAVVGVSISADKKLVLSASADKTAKMWNVADGKPVRTITEEVAIAQMTASRDRMHLALALDGGAIKVYQVADGALVSTLSGHETPAGSLSFSPDGARIVSADSKRAIVWDRATGRLLEILPAEAGLSSAAYGTTPNEVLLATADGALTVHGLRFALALGDMTQAVTGLAYSGDGQSVYTGSADGTVRRFTVQNGQQAFSADHGAPVHDLALSPNGQLLASAGENQVVKLFNAGNGQPGQPPQIEGFSGPVLSVAFSADSTRVVAGGAQAGEVLVFNVPANAVEQKFVEHSDAVAALSAAGEGGELIVSASADGTVRKWRLLLRQRLAGHAQPVTSLASVPAETPQIVSGSTDGTVRHWNLENGQPIRNMNHGGPVTAVAARGDGQRFASSSENNTIRLWNAANGQQLAQMQGDIRLRTRVARLEQELAIATARVETTKAAAESAATVAPMKAEVAKTAAAALTEANTAVEQAQATFEKTSATKTAAEKVAIEAAAAAQAAAQKKAEANLAVAMAKEAAERAAAKAERAKQLAAATPEDQELAQAAAAAEKVAQAAAEKVKAAETAAETAAKVATDAATKANDAATKAVEASKPFTEALAALREAQTKQNAASQESVRATQEAKEAMDAIGETKAAQDAAAARLTKVQTDLEAAKKESEAAQQPIQALAFSPDNRLLASGGAFPAVHTWDADSGEAVESFYGHEGAVLSVDFTADGDLVSGSADTNAFVWDPSPGWVLERQIGRIDDPTTLINRVVALDFSPDGKLIATGGGEPSRSGEVKVFNVEDGSEVLGLSDAHNDQVYGVSISRDGAYVASCGADKYVKFFDIASGEMVRKFEGHTDHVLCVDWRSDGKSLASGGADNVIRVWNADTGDQARAIGGFNKQVTDIKFIGESVNTLSSSGDRTVRMHRTDNGQNFRNFGGGTDFMYSVDVTPDARIVVAGGHDSVLRIWNGANGQVLQTLAAPEPEADADTEASTDEAERTEEEAQQAAR